MKKPEKIGAAAERIMQRYHGYRYFDWGLKDGVLEYSETPPRPPPRGGVKRRSKANMSFRRERRDLASLDAVATYKELTDIESGIRQLGRTC